MKTFVRASNVRALLWFLAALLLLLAIGVMFSISRQRALLLDEVNAHIDRELTLLDSIISEDLLKHDYTGVSQYLTVFGSQHPEINAISAIGSNGFVLAEYRRGAATVRPLKRRYCVTYGERKCVMLELTYDLGPVKKNLDALTRNYLFASLLFAAAMGGALWYVLRKTAFLPLEKALAELDRANAGLEQRVAERTTEWMRANTDLTNEISEREAAERELLESEAKFKSFAEQAIVGIYLIQDDRIKYCNPRFAEMFGYAPEEFPSDMNFQGFIHPDDLHALQERLKKRLAGDIPSSNYQFRGVKKTGGVIYLEVYGTTIRHEGRPAAIGTLLDVTERSLAMQALWNSEVNLHMVVENINDIIYRVSLKDDPLRGKVEFVSGQVSHIVGYQAEEFLQDPRLWLTLVHPDDRTMLGESTRRMVQDHSAETRLYRLRHKETSEYVWFEDKVVPQRDQGNIVGYFGVARDITRRKRAEDALKDALTWAEEEKNKSAAIIAAIGDGISIQGTDYRILYQNEIHKKIMGNHIGEYCYRAYQQREGICEGCAVVLSFADGRIHTTERIAATDNGVVHVETIASPLRDAAGEVVAAIEVVRDITDRKKAEAERERLIRETQDALETASRSRREWQETFDSITDLISIEDEDYTIIKANRAFARQFNLEPADVINRKCYELFHNSRSPIAGCTHERTLSENRRTTAELSDPGTGKIFQVSLFPYTSLGSHSRGVIHIARDITNTREQEMRLIMSERLASLGQMASGIAHEINNPLAAIAGCVDGLSRRINKEQYDPDLFKKYLKIIKEEIARSKNITNSMLSFVRKNAYEKKPVNVHKTLEKTLELIGYQGRLKGVDVKRSFTRGFPAVLGSEGELRQVFLIIITNALDAMGDKGVLTVETGIEDRTASVTIADTGPGIAPENIKRIFDPFFTTKSDRGGTGLGLSIAGRIIAAHNGTIRVQTEQNSGTTFKISLSNLVPSAD